MNLGVTLSELGRFDEALVWIRKSLRLEPDFADCHVNLGMTLARQGNLDEALRCYEQALRLRPDFPEARRNRAYIWLARGDFERGWPEYEWRLKCPKFRTLTVNRPRWNGEDLEGRTILLHAEQGLGDTLQFIRFAPLVKQRGGRVLVACPRTAVRLVARCRGVDLAVDWMSPLPDCDVQAPLLSLPAIFGTTLANLPAEIPYLGVDSEAVEDWRPVVARAIGRGAGRPDRRPREAGSDLQDRNRVAGESCQSGRPLALVPARSFRSPRRVDRRPSDQFAEGRRLRAARQPGRTIPRGGARPWISDGEGRRDFLDTAAVMSQLDLVVTPDSAVAHLAGGLGVRVWVALSTVGEWRWLIDREDSPWYPTMRLFRQTVLGDWESVFERMAALSQELTA